MGTVHKSPKTTQERRANCCHDFLEIDGYEVPVRSCRNMSNLPNDWWDIMRGDWGDKSWKRHRGTQYRCKKI